MVEYDEETSAVEFETIGMIKYVIQEIRKGHPDMYWKSYWEERKI